MKTARFVLKIVSLSLATAALVCAVIGYWDSLWELGTGIANRVSRRPSEYDDYDEE